MSDERTRAASPAESSEPVESATVGATPPTARVDSVDALRGLTILTMVFVNDVGPAAPTWAHHIQPPDADGMTVADIVFPGFLFIVGMSIPLAFERARQSQVTLFQQIVRILSRTLALLLMGVVELNAALDTTLGQSWWGVLAYTCIIFAWCIVPRTPGLSRKVLRTIKVGGIVGLIVLLAIYRRAPIPTEVAFWGEVQDWVWLVTGWWGILGLIGWAYLVAALLYLAIGSRREWLMGGVAILTALFIVDRGGGFFLHVESKAWLEGAYPLFELLESAFVSFDRFVDIGSMIGGHPSITVAGCLLGTVLIPRIGLSEHRDRIRWALTFVLGLCIAALVTDTFAGINKVDATPTWCLLCAAITVLVWLGLYAIMDIWGFKGWSIVIRPAGASPLIAYLLHPVLLRILDIGGWTDVVLEYKQSESAVICMLGSLAMALIICAATGLIARGGLRVRI